METLTSRQFVDRMVSDRIDAVGVGREGCFAYALQNGRRRLSAGWSGMQAPTEGGIDEQRWKQRAKLQYAEGTAKLWGQMVRARHWREKLELDFAVLCSFAQAC